MITTYVRVMADTELVKFLRKEVERTSFRDVEGKTGVNRGALENLLNKPTVLPTLRTLKKIARAYSLPLWRVVEMTGFDLDLPETPTERARRLVDLSERLPQYAQLIDGLFDLDAEEADIVLLYLELIRRRRQDREGGEDLPPEDRESGPSDLPRQ